MGIADYQHPPARERAEVAGEQCFRGIDADHDQFGPLLRRNACHDAGEIDIAALGLERADAAADVTVGIVGSADDLPGIEGRRRNVVGRALGCLKDPHDGNSMLGYCSELPPVGYA